MATPQQPELRRSGDNALQPGGPDDVAAAPSKPDVGGDTGPVPSDNLPGHHPADEQDKPDPDDFVAKAREVAARAKAEGTVKKPANKKQAAKKQAAGEQAAPVASTPPSSAPVAAAGEASVAAADEADAPRATPEAVVADAMTSTAAGTPSTGTPSTGTPAGSTPSPSPSPAPAPAGGTNPLLQVARFQWKLATLPIRTAIDLADKLRRRLL
jgi:hypothetical protein